MNDTKCVLHVKDFSILASNQKLTELREYLYLAFAYEETLGETTYRHYDVWGVRRKKAA